VKELKLALMYASMARVIEVQIGVEGMKAENQERQYLGQAPAYPEAIFVREAERVASEVATLQQIARA
jgi:hypothetical protein